MKNKFNLYDIVTISNGKEEYKIIGMELNTYNKPKKIWYKLYCLSNGNIITVAENIINKIKEN